MSIAFHNGSIINADTGEVITSSLSPRFPIAPYESYKKDFPQIRFLDPMSCFEHELANDGLDALPTEGIIYQIKYDGHRSYTYLTDSGNRSFSRRISKKTGWYSENSDCIPHIRDFKVKQELRRSLLDGEMVLGHDSMDMQSVMGALPERAIDTQSNLGFCDYYVFDLPYYKGNRITKRPLLRRLELLWELVCKLDHPSIIFAPCYTFDRELAKRAKFPIALIEDMSPREFIEQLWDNKIEGAVYKEAKARYEHKKSVLWHKVKKLFFRDVVVMGYTAPTKYYDGKTLDDGGTWDYWERYDEPDVPIIKELTKKQMEEDGEIAPLTKPFAMGWVGSITCGVYRDGKLFKVADVKGISDENLQYIADHQEELIGSCLEIKFNDYIDDSRETCRHPRFSRWREDKNADDCTFAAWTNRPEEGAGEKKITPRRLLQKKKILRRK